MFYLRDLPKYEALRQRAARYPEIDPRAFEAFLVLLRVGSDVLDGLEAYLASRGMSQGKFTILMLLNRDPDVGVSPSDLAERSGVTRATITGLLDGLSREKLVSREDDTDDRRKAVVRLTARGRKVLDGIVPDYYRHVSQLMGDLTDDEKATLVGLLAKVNQRLGSLWAAAGKQFGDKAATDISTISADPTVTPNTVQ
jgi:MarR family transcriptional regulator, negative regulator of the multidrug operon emrRAB